jgi:hypothetical protein
MRFQPRHPFQLVGANPYTNPKYRTGTNAHAEHGAGSIANTNTYTYTDADADTDTHSDAKANTHANAKANADPTTFTNADANANAHANSNPDADADADANSTFRGPYLECEHVDGCEELQGISERDKRGALHNCLRNHSRTAVHGHLGSLKSHVLLRGHRHQQ